MRTKKCGLILSHSGYKKKTISFKRKKKELYLNVKIILKNDTHTHIFG